MTRKWLLSSSEKNISALYCFYEGIFERLDYLDETVRRGEPPALAWEWFDKNPTGWKDYNAAMIAATKPPCAIVQP
jgi:hypothetical protein